MDPDLVAQLNQARARADALSYAQTVVRAHERGQWDVPKTYDLARELLAAQAERDRAVSLAAELEPERDSLRSTLLTIRVALNAADL